MGGKIIKHEVYGEMHCHHEYFFHVVRSGKGFAVCTNPSCKKEFELTEVLCGKELGTPNNR